MKKSVLISPNAFKECADSVETANIIKRCFNSDEYNINILPLSDGGDGFLRVCTLKFNAPIKHAVFPSPAGDRQVLVPFGLKGNTAYIESAKVVGLNLIPRELRNPLYYNTNALGMLLKYISNNHPEVREILIGIGGTGTNDLGIGAAFALGIKLFDINDTELDPIPVNFSKVKKILYQSSGIPFKIKVVTDVDNILLGSSGATQMFARQKGASDEDVEIMERGFENVCSILTRDGIITSPDILSGAGGGLAAGLQAFFDARVVHSKDFIINDLGLKSFDDVDIVITGEGRFDQQSLMNKAPGVIVDYFKNSSSKVFIICGSAESGIKDFLPGNSKIIEMREFFNSTEDSIKNFTGGIELACNKIITGIRT